jgi:peptide deformylase
MTIKKLPVARMGHPILAQKAEPVDLHDLDKINKILADMRFTLESIGERIGLAAPQVHIPLRIVIFSIPKVAPNPRYDFDREEVPFTVMINPEIVYLTDKQSLGWEGCISVPGMLGEVPRYESIRYTFYDETRVQQERVADGFHARVVQHECDHLDGILFPMRMTDMSKFGFEEEMIEFVKNKTAEN